jgi:hypothetical protein
MSDITHVVYLSETAFDEVVEIFEFYMPQRTHGYVRKFDRRDEREGYFDPGRYGFFSSKGLIVASAETEGQVVEEVTDEEFLVHTLH